MKPLRQTQVRVDALTRFCLAAITVLLVVLVLGLWAEVPRAARPAAGAEAPRTFGDAGGQREAQTAELRKIREGLDELTALFRKGEAQVRLAGGPAEVPAVPVAAPVAAPGAVPPERERP